VCVFVNHNDRVAEPQGMIGGVTALKQMFEPKIVLKDSREHQLQHYSCVYTVQVCKCASVSGRFFGLQNSTCNARYADCAYEMTQQTCLSITTKTFISKHTCNMDRSCQVCKVTSVRDIGLCNVSEDSYTILYIMYDILRLTVRFAAQ